MDILQALHQDHQNVRELLDRLVATDTANTALWNEVVESLRDELIPHSRAEEAILYNSLRDQESCADLVAHSYPDHVEAEALLRTLPITDSVGIHRHAAAVRLKQAMDEHIDREESATFAAARRSFSIEEREAMGEAFVRMKPEVKDESIVGNTFDAIVNLMPARLRGSVRQLVA